ncbi:MAG: PKD domain-containing protein [Bacteroidota bacterium]
MKYAVSPLVLLFSLVFSSVNTQTSLSGVVNVYGQLSAQDECNNSITLSNASAFAPGMGIIILQTTGATINLSNSGSYGDIEALNGSGDFEYNRIVDITGNEATLELAIQHNYTPTLTQVIGFQIYDDATVDNLVTPSAWNGSTGGVVALEVTGTLTLNADIDASGAGFLGGAPFAIEDNNCSFLFNYNNYSYESDDWRGAPKGEGIGQAAANEPHGRGAQANGGGGGNDHNSGGGGGALYTPGGVGGTNNEPSTFGCDGDFPGRGGKALNTGLLFLGGGGGSGHGNNDNPSGGGNGGGIIIIKAASVNFSGGALRSNGQSAITAQGDGGGGGGAGGNILLIADNLAGTSNISATGGNGANANNGNRERCFGPGGGGSGGAFWSNQTATATLSGGTPGLSTNSTECSDGTNGAEQGATGLTFELAELPQGETFGPPMITAISTDTVTCVDNLITLSAEIDDPDVMVQWQRFDGATWQSLTDVPGVYAGTTTTDLLITASPATAGFYRIIITPNNECFDTTPSAQILLTVLDQAGASPSFTVDGLTANFLANITNGQVLQWTFEPGQTSTAENPSYTFPAGGTYPVTLIISNDCGEQEYELQVTVAEAIVAAASASSQEGCAPFIVVFEDQTAGNVTERNWTFPGGEPATSTASSPVVTFAAPGSYEVLLEVSNGTNSSTTTINIEVFTPPSPAFSIMTDQLTISLQNLSTGATSFVWNFGDGNTSMETNPMHTYASPGTYEVTLNASNDRCAVAAGQTVSVGTTSTNEVAAAAIRFFPNPVTETLQIENWQRGTIQLFTINGQLLKTWTNPSPTVDVGDVPAGVYVLGVLLDGQAVYERLIVQ